MNDFSRLNSCNGRCQIRQDWPKIDQAVTSHAGDDEAEAERAEVVLSLHPLIDRDKHIEVLVGEPQQLAVLAASPTNLRHR